MVKSEYVAPFFQATKEVFKLMLDLDIRPCGPESLKLGDRKVAVAIEVVGDLTGTILYQFPENMILTMVGIMSGMEINQLDGFVTSALGEVSNIISGNATTGLSAENYQCDIKPPQITVGESESRCTAPGALSVPLTTPIGNMLIDISLKENKA